MIDLNKENNVFDIRDCSDIKNLKEEQVRIVMLLGDLRSEMLYLINENKDFTEVQQKIISAEFLIKEIRERIYDIIW